MNKKTAYYLIGFSLGLVAMFLVATLCNQLELIFNWDIAIVFFLALFLFIYFIKRKYIDEYTLKGNETDFQIIYGDMMVNYADAAKALKNSSFKFENFEVGLPEVQELRKEFILLKPETNYFYLNEAIEYGKSLGFKESSWHDLYALSKVNDKKTSVYNVIETLNEFYLHPHGTMVAYMNKSKEFKITFKDSRHYNDYAVLMVKEKK